MVCFTQFATLHFIIADRQHVHLTFIHIHDESWQTATKRTGLSKPIKTVVKFMLKQEIYAQRAQTSADPEDPDFGLWTPGSEA